MTFGPAWGGHAPGKARFREAAMKGRRGGGRISQMAHCSLDMIGIGRIED